MLELSSFNWLQDDAVDCLEGPVPCVALRLTLKAPVKCRSVVALNLLLLTPALIWLLAYEEVVTRAVFDDSAHIVDLLQGV